MLICEMKTNRIEKPLGFDYSSMPCLSWLVAGCVGSKQQSAQVVVAKGSNFENIIFDSGKTEEIDSLGYTPNITLEPYTRYYWKVTVWTDKNEIATNSSYFETAKLGEPWLAKWITPCFDDKNIHPALCKQTEIKGKVKNARAYVCGFGLYELYINGVRTGDEYLAPGCNAYDQWIQYQTYDVTGHFQEGQNQICAILGNGWYKGRFTFGADTINSYGDKMAFLCEIRIEFENGDKTVIISDETFEAYKSPVLDSNIYDGEHLDSNIKYPWDIGFSGQPTPCSVADIGFGKLMARLSPPMKKMHEIKPTKIIITPSGETVLDMGQNMVGWVEFDIDVPKGTEVLLQFGEILHEGNFFRENLRTAKAEFKYISDGKPHYKVRPHFTFFGFRYVKISGWHGIIDAGDFTGCVIYSEMKQTGKIETSNSLVNRLFENAIWGQRGNFLDVPTDCPQRDERMGWTGDAQVFSGTACYNTDCYAFFTKFGYDMYMEQLKYDGLVTHVVPAINYHDGGSSAWSDAATIIPWTVYLHFGDKTILERQFGSMKAWADYIRRIDEKTGNKKLWTVGFHYGDWLALEKLDKNSPWGATDPYFIASSYYRHSTLLVSKAARVLGKNDIADEYAKLSEEIKNAIQDEYITKNGRILSDTQTAYVLALWFDIAYDSQIEKMKGRLVQKIKDANNHLTTGFVGTAYLCKALSEYGLNDVAYSLLLTEEYPGWLYCVKNGATTIWERWDSYMPDGKLGDLGMNSFNHYAFGSIAEWMYRNILGINNVESKPGFRHTLIRPRPDKRLNYAKGSVETAAGKYEVSWKYINDEKLSIKIEIPFNCTADVILPDGAKSFLNSGHYNFEVSVK